MSGYFFFDPTSVTMVLMAEFYFFCSPMWSRLCSQNLRFLSFLFFLSYSEDSTTLVWDRTEAFFLADFAFLGLDSSGRGSFAVVTWICTLEAVLLRERWPQKQQISEFRTILLDLRPALASALTILCIISSKFMDSLSYCSISTLIKGLSLSQK